MRQALGLFLGVIVGVSGCAAPLPVVRLQPHGPDVIWVSGRALASRARDGVRTAVAFDHQEGNAIVFRVEVQNDAEAQFDVDPKDMRFTACVAEKICGARTAVTDPEQALIALDQAHAQAEADRANNLVAGTALVLLSAAADTAAAVKGHRPRDLTTQAVVATEISDQQHAATVDSIISERDKWAVVALGPSTLFPGQSLAGFVYVPLVTDARYLWLDVAVGKRDFWFAFDQAVFRDHRVASSTR